MKKTTAIGICFLVFIFITFSICGNKVTIEKLITGSKSKNANVRHIEAGTADFNDFVPYKVKKGDTVYGICIENVLSFSVSKASKMIMKKNNLKGNEDIKEGQIILIPYKNPGNDIEYVVKNGDSLLSIAHNLIPSEPLSDGINEIIENNNLTSVNDIEEGQVLLIPYKK